METSSYLSTPHSDTPMLLFHALALSFPDCPGSKRRQVSTEQNGHQREAGPLPCQRAWTRRYSAQLDGFHSSDRFWLKQALRGNTLYPLQQNQDAFREKLFGVFC